jgi:predicted glycoside hydrolase/deacetylase ChbG (UPF0249 family)
MTKKLIVNADDYGHTPGVSGGIRQAHLNGIVTSTSVMMNRPAAPLELEKAARLCPHLGIGLHLVLTTGHPVLPAEELPSLTQPDGSFYKLAGFIRNITHIELNQVFAEWHAQVEKFFKITGHAPDHLDSHHHSSYFTPDLLEGMLRLAEELNCPIRKPFGESSADPGDYLPAELAGQYVSQFADLICEYHPRTTNNFVGDFYDADATKENLLKLLEKISSDKRTASWEIMCHPALVDDELRAATTYNEPRARELEILQNAEVKAYIKSAGIKLINFSQL